MFDAEFIVLDVVEAKNGSRLRMATQEGKYFYATCPGKEAFKAQVLRDREKYLGSTVNVEYASLTKENKPFHPIATGFVNRQFD